MSENTTSISKKRLSRGKYYGLMALSDERGVIAALAMDQRGSLKKTLASATGRDVSASELAEFKALVTDVLTHYASAVLLDPEYGLEAAERRSASAGLILAYEASGYNTAVKGRIPSLLPGLSVARLIEAGANAIKVVVYYDPDDDQSINSMKQAFIERIGAECYAYDVPFFLELVSYSDSIGDEKSLAYALAKPEKVKKLTREFSQERYGVDILKLEIPINPRFVENIDPDNNGTYAYTREDAKEHFREVAGEAQVPFIYLSAGVSDEIFRASLELAAEAGTPYSGVLCGRATWQSGITAYAEGGKQALTTWLKQQGVQNIEALNAILRQGAQPWWNLYGGKDHLDIVDSFSLKRSLKSESGQ